MICQRCQHGQHDHCTGSGCGCPQRAHEIALEEVISRRSEDVQANMSFQGLMGTSAICAEFAEHFGATKVRAFIAEVLAARRAMYN